MNAAESLPPARVLLVGMMGAGKSTVGQALAAATGWPYVDNDELVRRAAGIVTPEVLDEQGERALRAVESAALGVALAIDPPVIAGIAAGVVTDAGDCTRLAGGGYVVWLRAAIATLAGRVGTGAGRPWLQPDPQTALRRLYEGRAQRYAEVAALIVDVDALTPAEIAARILAGLRGSAGSAGL